VAGSGFERHLFALELAGRFLAGDGGIVQGVPGWALRQSVDDLSRKAPIWTSTKLTGLVRYVGLPAGQLFGGVSGQGHLPSCR